MATLLDPTLMFRWRRVANGRRKSPPAHERKFVAVLPNKWRPAHALLQIGALAKLRVVQAGENLFDRGEVLLAQGNLTER
jgi:hypothetical protein